MTKLTIRFTSHAPQHCIDYHIDRTPSRVTIHDNTLITPPTKPKSCSQEPKTRAHHSTSNWTTSHIASVSAGISSTVAHYDLCCTTQRVSALLRNPVDRFAFCIALYHFLVYVAKREQKCRKFAGLNSIKHNQLLFLRFYFVMRRC